MSKLDPRRVELLRSKEYHAANMRYDLFGKVDAYLQEHKLTRAAFAERLGFTKSYVSQVLRGDSDVRVSKLVELSLAVELVPVLSFVRLSEYLRAEGKVSPAMPTSSAFVMAPVVRATRIAVVSSHVARGVKYDHAAFSVSKSIKSSSLRKQPSYVDN